MVFKSNESYSLLAAIGGHYWDPLILLEEGAFDRSALLFLVQLLSPRSDLPVLVVDPSVHRAARMGRI
jgi:hypothetical protein